VDLVLGQPMTSHAHDSILFMVDRFSKMSYFIVCGKTDDSSNVAKLDFRKIVQLHGLPVSIVTTWDVKFMRYFLKMLWKLCDTTLKFSAAFHPQTNGHTEFIN